MFAAVTTKCMAPFTTIDPIPGAYQTSVPPVSWLATFIVAKSEMRPLGAEGALHVPGVPPPAPPMPAPPVPVLPPMPVVPALPVVGLPVVVDPADPVVVVVVEPVLPPPPVVVVVGDVVEEVVVEVVVEPVLPPAPVLGPVVLASSEQAT